ncbi:hypothetical protein LB559_09450 [Mesorhizobium sp. BR1-1-3]|uniref:hypothetical protein n=1 Tax=Mesorhizobium sp. BR1-1-3 TaxID=2876651 RepID=UPI001CD0B4EA|nr:hypothetical protein [Mesorhizobium sp. BR1-1-3]MBZ9888164.1 hypothetical protein [Mesorhizobium sp. BR1-1-3]
MTQKQVDAMKAALERIANMNGLTLLGSNDYERGSIDAFVKAAEIAQSALVEVK